MVAEILDGKACAAAVEESLKERINKCQQAGITPHIAVIIVGDDPASHVYVGAKIRACERLGIKSTHIEMPESSKLSHCQSRLLPEFPTQHRTSPAGGISRAILGAGTMRLLVWRVRALAQPLRLKRRGGRVRVS